MRIIILHNTSDLYGASRILLFTAEALQTNGHQCIIVLSEEGLLTEELKKINIEFKIIRLGILRRKYFNVKGIINRIIVNKNAWIQLKRLIKEEKPDVIYSNTTGVLIGALVAKSSNVKHFWHLHEIIIKPKLFTIFMGWLVNRYSDKVIVVSDAVKQHWVKYIDEKKLFRIYNGIKTDHFEISKSTLRQELGIAEHEIIVTMIGRINHWKGQGYFLKIASLICQKNKNVKFIMVGDSYQGNEHLVKELEQTIMTLNLESKVVNLGYRIDINHILLSTDIFISPSILPDPFPTVILEAMASAKPIAATQHGGAKEMVLDGVTGFHIPINSADKAAEIITKMINDKELRDQFGVAGKKRLNELFSYQSFQINLLQTISN